MVVTPTRVEWAGYWQYSAKKKQQHSIYFTPKLPGELRPPNQTSLTLPMVYLHEGRLQSVTGVRARYYSYTKLVVILGFLYHQITDLLVKQVQLKPYTATHALKSSLLCRFPYFLIYGSETGTLYRAQVKKLEDFHVCCLQIIFGIIWHDLIPHVTILQNAGTISIECIIVSHQLRSVGHLIRMPESCLLCQIFYRELQDGTHAVIRNTIKINWRLL